jgi:Suppressor of fused protein (SUFU)
MAISDDNRKIAKQVASAFGGKPTVREFLHDSAELKIDLIYCSKRPDDDLVSIGTIGLSDYPFPWGDKEFPTRLEICALASEQAPLFLNLVASAAFNMIRSKTIATPGSVMRGYVSEYFPETKLPNLYFTAPFIWEGTLKMTAFETKKVSWLLCFPISDAEASFIEKNGDESFENLLQEAGIEIHDMNRDSVV